MAQEIEERLNKFFKLMSEHHLIITSDVNEDFKCVICKDILKDPYQSECYCNFCHVCIDNYIKSGATCCPGDTKECKSCDILNVTKDHKINKQISSIIVNCPVKMCYFECELINLNEHLQMCIETSVKCPFESVGCDLRLIVRDKLKEHFQLNNDNHNKLLIDSINNIKNEIELKQNEIVLLKESDERSKTTIELLKEDKIKSELGFKETQEELLLLKKLIDLKTDEINLLKQENERNKIKFELVKQNECENKNIISNLKETISRLKVSNHINNVCRREFKQRIENLKEELENLLENKLQMTTEIKLLKEKNKEECEYLELRTDIIERNYKKFIKYILLFLGLIVIIIENYFFILITIIIVCYDIKYNNNIVKLF